MSYLVLARKWRPQKFDDVIGQDHISQTLKNAIQNGKLAQAYLFVGPRGVGKTSCARILSMSLNCKDAPTPKPCGKCSACVEIAQGRSLDVIEIDGASNRGIDEIRTLRENVKFAPSFGSYKIYIIDEVHMLTPEAFNALLKTLEEPPEHVKFIFATTRPDKVLPTILSRCQRFEFHRIPTLKIIEKLQEIAKHEKIAIEKEVLFNIAKISDGSMRDAESVLDQLVSFSKGKIKVDDIVQVMGLIEQDIYFEFIDAVNNKDAQTCIDFISILIKRGKDIAKFLDGLMWHLRNLMLAKIMKSSLEELEGLMDLPKDIIKRIVDQSNKLSLNQIVNLFSSVTAAQDMAKKIGSFRIPLEVMVVKVTQSVGYDDPTPKVSGVGATNKQSSSVPSTFGAEKKLASKLKLDNVGALFIGRGKKDPDISDIPAQKDVAVEDAKQQGQVDIVTDQPEEKKEVLDKEALDIVLIEHGWDKFINSVSQKKMSVGTYLRDSRPMSLKEDTLTVGFPKRAVFYKEALEQRHNQDLVHDIFKKIFKSSLILRFELVDKVSNQDEVELADEEYLKSVIDTFQGRVFERD